MKVISVIFFLVTCTLSAGKLRGQGCSDAGFCTIGNINHHGGRTTPQKKQKLSLILSNGVGDESVYVFTPGLQYDNTINKNWSVQGKITGNYASGNLGNATVPGDIFLSAIYKMKEKNNWQTSFLLGTKLPLSIGDIRTGGKPLPMQYQSSLGTVDLLAGITAANNKWLFAAAVQQPLTGTNRNTFLPEYLNTPEAARYAPTNDFKRSGDVLLRAGYNLLTTPVLNINVGLLSIYHLGADTYINGNISNKSIALKGSAGLTLNGTAAIHYMVSDKFSIGLSGGVPFVVRDLRPDGLTRKFVLSPEFIVNF